MWFGVHSQCRWWLLICGAGGDAGCDAGSLGAPGAPIRRVGASYWCRCTWACAVLGGCRWGVAGCCVLCFLFCACAPLLTACMHCSSYLYSGFFRTTPDASGALCLVLHCAAALNVRKSLIQMPQQHHHENLSQHTSQYSCSSYETQCHVPEPKHSSETPSQCVTKHHDQHTQWNKQHQLISAVRFSRRT